LNGSVSGRLDVLEKEAIKESLASDPGWSLYSHERHLADEKVCLRSALFDLDDTARIVARQEFAGYREYLLE
jgi:hypothetical protein